MRALALLLAVLALAGCASPEGGAPTPDASPDAQTGPVDLTGKSGLLLVDLDTRAVAGLTQTPGLAWMSENATVLTWTEETFSVALDRASGGREVAPLTLWARVYENGTGLELAAGAANVREIVTGNVRDTKPLPPAPVEGRAWTGASDDLAVLAAEYAVSGRGSCSSDIILRAGAGERTVGCHLEVASDGRVGWTEGRMARVRGLDGAIVDHEGFENPVFTRDGVVMLRVTGSAPISLTEVVTPDGEVLAKLDGPRGLALQDVSADGRYLLVRTFGG